MGGTVRRLNDITAQLDDLDLATTPPEVIHRLKRDEFTALNSTLLHELYFASIGGDGRAVPTEMTAALTRDFGSPNRWRDAPPAGLRCQVHGRRALRLESQQGAGQCL